MRYVIGVDPGKTGAVAVLHADDGGVKFVVNMPVIEVGSLERKSKSKRSEYDAGKMAGFVQSMAFLGGARHVLLAVEQVGAMPGEGAVGAFKFGTGFGIWLGIAAALEVRVERVAPKRWRGAMLAGLPAGKGASLLRARELFPGEAALASCRKDAGPADALLIAEYARRHLMARMAPFEEGAHA